MTRPGNQDVALIVGGGPGISSSCAVNTLLIMRGLIAARRLAPATPTSKLLA